MELCAPKPGDRGLEASRALLEPGRSALLLRRRGGSRPATLYSTSWRPSGWVPSTPERFLSGLHQPSAPRTHPLTPRLPPPPLPWPRRVTPPWRPASGGGGGPASREGSGELLPAAQWRGRRPGRSLPDVFDFIEETPAPDPKATGSLGKCALRWAPAGEKAGARGLERWGRTELCTPHSLSGEASLRLWGLLPKSPHPPRLATVPTLPSPGAKPSIRGSPCGSDPLTFSRLSALASPAPAPLHPSKLPPDKGRRRSPRSGKQWGGARGER